MIEPVSRQRQRQRVEDRLKGVDSGFCRTALQPLLNVNAYRPPYPEIRIFYGPADCNSDWRPGVKPEKRSLLNAMDHDQPDKQQPLTQAPPPFAMHLRADRSINYLLLLRLIHHVNDKHSSVPKATQTKKVISLKTINC